MTTPNESLPDPPQDGAQLPRDQSGTPQTEDEARRHEFATGDQVYWHNEIAKVDFPGYRDSDSIRIELPPVSDSRPDYRWVDRSELRAVRVSATYEFSTCSCGKDRQVKSHPEYGEPYRRLMPAFACRSCEADFAREQDMCPESIVRGQGVTACRLTWAHTGRCEPFDFARKNTLRPKWSDEDIDIALSWLVAFHGGESKPLPNERWNLVAIDALKSCGAKDHP